MRKWLMVCTALMPTPTLAQSAGTLALQTEAQSGTEITPGQVNVGVNAQLANKVDTVAGHLVGPVITGGSASSMALGSPAITGGTATGTGLSGGTVTNAAISGGTLTGAAVTGGTATSVVSSGPRIGVLPGCAGNGTTDDTTCVQTALNRGGTIHTGNGALYKIMSSLTMTVPGTEIVGEGGNMGIYNFSCTAGFFAGVPNLSLLYITASNTSVRKTCFQMGTTLSANTSGAAVTFTGPGGAGTSIAGILAEDNQVNYPFIGFDLTSLGVSQLIGGTVHRNTVTQLGAGGAAFRIGAAGVNGNEGDLHLEKNVVVCQTTNSGVAFLWLDGGGNYANDNEAYNCGTGTKIFPAAGQHVENNWWHGLLGDTSSVNDLLIDSNGGVVQRLHFMQTWTSGNTSKIQNTGSGLISNIDFNGHRSILQSNNSSIGLDIEAGDSISFRDGRTVALNSSPTDIALKVGASATNVSLTGNAVSSSGGTQSPGTGIQIATGASNVLATSNDLSGATTPLAYTPSTATTDAMVLGLNKGVDDGVGSVTAAATVSLPPNPIVYVASGSASIATMYGKWSNRTVKLTASGAGGFSLVTGGATGNGFCAAATVPQYSSINLTYSIGFGCWAAG